MSKNKQCSLFTRIQHGLVASGFFKLIYFFPFSYYRSGMLQELSTGRIVLVIMKN